MLRESSGENKMDSSNNVALISLVSFFLIMALITPFINQSFNQPSNTVNTDDLGISDEDLQDTSINVVNAYDVFSSLLKMPFFTFGDLPVWFDLCVLLPLRIWMWIIIYDKVRGI